MRQYRYRRRLAGLWITALLVALLASPGSTPPALASSLVEEMGAPYVFPITPQDEEWRSFRTHNEMLAAIQIPQDVLASQTTGALLETVLDYPLAVDLFAFDNPQLALDQVASQFNGLGELLGRHDAGHVLLAKYKSISIAVGEDWAIDRTARHLFDLHIVEILLAQAAVLDDLQPQPLDELVDASVAKMFQKEDARDIYGYAGREGSLWIAGRVLLQKGSTQLAKEAQENPALAIFLETGQADGSIEVYSAVLSAAGCSRQLGQDDSGVEDYSTYVYTPKGSPVSVIYRTWELSPAEIDAINRATDQAYPLASRLRSASRKYNCHSYAWYSQGAGNTIWMNDPQTYWNDGSYRPTNNQSPGVRLVYAPDRQHSAIVDSPTGYYVKSKWGQAGLYYHPYWYGPYGSSVARYERNY